MFFIQTVLLAASHKEKLAPLRVLVHNAWNVPAWRLKSPNCAVNWMSWRPDRNFFPSDFRQRDDQHANSSASNADADAAESSDEAEADQHTSSSDSEAAESSEGSDESDSEDESDTPRRILDDLENRARAFDATISQTMEFFIQKCEISVIMRNALRSFEVRKEDGYRRTRGFIINNGKVSGRKYGQKPQAINKKTRIQALHSYTNQL